MTHETDFAGTVNSEEPDRGRNTPRPEYTGVIASISARHKQMIYRRSFGIKAEPIIPTK